MRLNVAGIKTRKQIELLKLYTKKMVNQSSKHLIFVDGSINAEDDQTPTLTQKLQQTGCGDHGWIHETKSKNQAHNYFWNTTSTCDAQAAGLQGIHTTLQLAHEMKAEEMTMLRECRDATNYNNGNYTTPFKCAQECQKVTQLLVYYY